jgi:hypothetical protein
LHKKSRAVIEAVNKSESGDSPLLALPQGGVAVLNPSIAESVVSFR